MTREPHAHYVGPTWDEELEMDPKFTDALIFVLCVLAVAAAILTSGPVPS